MADTPGQLPTLNEATRVKTDIGTLGRWGALLVSVVISGTIFYVKTDDATALGRENAAELKEIRKELSDLRYDLYRVGVVPRKPADRSP